MNDLDVLEAVTKLACDAIERAERWYREILEQRHAGKDASEAAYERLARLDAEALRATELYYRATMDALDEAPRF